MVNVEPWANGAWLHKSPSSWSCQGGHIGSTPSGPSGDFLTRHEDFPQKQSWKAPDLQVFLGLCMAQGAVSQPFPGSTQSPTPCVQRFARSQIWQDFGVVWSIEQVTIEKVGLKHWSIENLSRLKTKSRIHQKVKISENLWQIDLFWDTSNILIPLQKNTDPSEIAMRSSLTNRAPKLDLIHSTTGPIWSGSMSIGWDFHVLTMERLTWFLDAYTAFHSRFGYIYIHNDI